MRISIELNSNLHFLRLYKYKTRNFYGLQLKKNITKHKIDLLTKIQVTERILHKIESFNLNEQRKNKLDIVCKFSYSNENEILLGGNKGAPMSLPTTSKLKNYNTSSVVKQMKNKSKSEEKFNNSPSYQIFLAKYPEIKKQLLRFKNKARLSKIPSNNSSPKTEFLVPEEEQKENEDSQESSEENEEEKGDEIIFSLTEKKSKKFKEDVNPFRVAASNSSLYYLGPVKEEKKEDISETSSSSSSDSSDDDDSGSSQDTHKTINTNRTHNTHASKISKVSKLKLNTKPPANHEDNNEDNFDDHDEISLKKGYMSDENECGTATMKRRT